MVTPTKSDNAEASRSMSNNDEKDAEWKELVESGMAAFAKERYTVAEISFKSAHELAEKLLEELVGKDTKDAAAEDGAASAGTAPPSKEHVDAAKTRLTKSLNNLAALYHVQGKYGMAEELYEKCLDLKLELYGEEHLEVAVNLHNLAVLHSAKRKFGKAELLYKRAIEIREKLLGADHKDLVPVLKNYALLLKKTKRTEDGIKLEERCNTIEPGSVRPKSEDANADDVPGIPVNITKRSS